MKAVTPDVRVGYVFTKKKKTSRYLYTYIRIYIYTYSYIERERERERESVKYIRTPICDNDEVLYRR